MSYLAVAPCVLVKNQTGGVDYHYSGVNPQIPWLSDEQAERFLAEGFVIKAGPKHQADDESAEGESAGDPGGTPKQPAKTATLAAWVDYGVSKLGEEKRDELAQMAKPELQELLG